VPHDAQAKELGTGKSRLEVLASLGLEHITLAPLHRIVSDGTRRIGHVGPNLFLAQHKFDPGGAVHAAAPAVARMSEGKSGAILEATDPGYRFAHPGYETTTDGRRAPSWSRVTDARGA
jgi:hypothetical protein